MNIKITEIIKPGTDEVWTHFYYGNKLKGTFVAIKNPMSIKDFKTSITSFLENIDKLNAT